MKPSSENNVNRYRIAFLSPELKYRIRKYGTSTAMRLATLVAYVLAPILPKSITCLDRPIFIIGCSRSGTTLFVDMLREHDDIAEWSEAGGVFEPRYFNPAIDHVKDEQDATEPERRRLRVLFGIFTRIRGKRRFLNKHPQNSLRLGYLHAIFPDARYIHLIREGCATAYSNYKQIMRDKYRQAIPFGSFPKPPAWKELLRLPLLQQFGHQWKGVVTCIRESVARYGLASRYIEIRYERFCADPHGTLRQLDEFCGLDPMRRRYDRIAQSFDARNDSWRKRVPPDEASALQAICHPLNAELGYEPAAPGSMDKAVLQAGG